MTENDGHATFDSEADEAREARLDAEAEADYLADRIIPHEHIGDWLFNLAKGRRAPPPEA